jgi:polyhydroxyalkanoate synthesis regulator phasin
MQEIVDRLVNNVGLTPEQAKKSVEEIIAHVKEKFPMMEGMLGQFFGSNN